MPTSFIMSADRGQILKMDKCQIKFSLRHGPLGSLS